MRIKITLQYLGTNYAGWQVQKNQITIQSVVEQAIKQALKEDCEIFASGRTDAGVHAEAQTAHFDTTTRIKPEKIAYAINNYLPQDIKILKSEQVGDDFNARFDVKRKTYEYNFYTGVVELPLLSATNAKVRAEFDFQKAKQNINCFLGKHDFIGFCSANNQSATTERTIFDIQLIDKGNNQYKLSITGDGFLYNMVRIIAGTIIDIGCGIIDANDLPNIIESKDRSKAGKTAPAKGLTLKKVEY